MLSSHNVIVDLLPIDSDKRRPWQMLSSRAATVALPLFASSSFYPCVFLFLCLAFFSRAFCLSASSLFVFGKLIDAAAPSSAEQFGLIQIT